MAEDLILPNKQERLNSFKMRPNRPWLQKAYVTQFLPKKKLCLMY